MYKVPLYIPSLSNTERRYLIDAYDSSWISSKGKYINLSQDKISKLLNRKHTILTSSGTTALHLALEGLKLKKSPKPNSCVILPTLTYVSTLRAVQLAGLIPLLCDVNSSAVMDDENLKKAIVKAKEKDLDVYCILPVNLYGNISKICYRDYKNYSYPDVDAFLLEDSCESFGSEYNKQLCGNSKSDIACFSLFGNKVITSGEGGFLCLDDDELFQKLNILGSVGQKSTGQQRYQHIECGFNYRMTNLQAAVLYGQLERFDEISTKKRKVGELYKQYLKEYDLEQYLLPVSENTDSIYWMITLITKSNSQREGLILYLESCGVETRPAFLPMHCMINLGNLYRVNDMSVSENISSCGLNLPSFADLKEEEIKFVCEKIKEFFDRF